MVVNWIDLRVISTIRVATRVVYFFVEVHPYRSSTQSLVLLVFTLLILQSSFFLLYMYLLYFTYLLIFYITHNYNAQETV